MEKRKELILNTIIKEHIKTAAPVGSSGLVDKYKLDISPATVRNEMAELEEEGYIIQPHTSAGRVPTEKAYYFFLKNLKEKKLTDAEAKLIDDMMAAKSEQDLKHTAKLLSQLSNQAVFWAVHRNNLYYTGIANILSQPEFGQSELIYDISAIIDQLDEIINRIFDQVQFGPQIFVGSDNPFSQICTTVICKYKLDGMTGLFGILGPMRMNYEKNLALVKYINNKLIEK